MATTQIFAELLVIGIGPVFWVSLLLAATVGYRFDAGIPRPDTWSFVAFLGVTYVLGIVVDRLAHAVFEPLEARSSATTKRPGLPEPWEIERYVLVSSEALGRQMQYNRSRLRICRAWVLNAPLVSLAFVLWNARVRAVPFVPSLVFVGVGLAVCALMGWTTRALLPYHYKNLVGSYEFLKKNEPKARGS